MPLHLLGKKSWNVYNPENIARVRKDEAAAEAQERDNDRQNRKDEAARRLKLMRGDASPSPDRETSRVQQEHTKPRSYGRKHRKLAGEDDTDRDMRLARETVTELNHRSITDAKGNISLIPGSFKDHQSRQDDNNNSDLKAMRFKDAAGYKQGAGKPWYSTGASRDTLHDEKVGHNVWGDEDPRRRERDQQRLSMNDPLLAMKKGVRRLRDNEKEKQEWRKQRERDLYEVEETARKRQRHSHRDDSDSLEDFSLDGNHVADDRSARRARRRDHDRHRHSRHSKRDRSKSPRRSRGHQ